MTIRPVKTPLDPQSLDFLTEIATRHYLHGSSQIEIARDLGLDPSTISRSLKRARDEGIVRVEIVMPRRSSVELGLSLAAHLDVPRAVVAEVPDGPYDAVTSLAPVAAAFISDQLHTGSRIGIGWGQAIAAVVHQMAPGVVSDLHVTQLAGGLADAQPGIQGHELARELTEIFPRSRATYLHAPSIVDSVAIRDALMADRSVQAALAGAGHTELAIVGIGQLDADATLLTASHILMADRAALLAQGAVGSMNSRFYDADGQPVGHLDRRTIAIEWDDLQRIPMVIAVAAGAAKVQAIAAAMRTGCVNVLITDEPTAQKLLLA